MKKSTRRYRRIRRDVLDSTPYKIEPGELAALVKMLVRAEITRERLLRRARNRNRQECRP